MTRRLVAILVLIAVGVQTLPLHVCAVEVAVTGGSCHDEDAALTDATHVEAMARVDGHAASNGGSHDPSCLCDAPKGELDRYVAHAVPLHLFVNDTPAVNLNPLSTGLFSPFASHPPPDVPAFAVSLPLLN